MLSDIRDSKLGINTPAIRAFTRKARKLPTQPQNFTVLHVGEAPVEESTPTPNLPRQRKHPTMRGRQVGLPLSTSFPTKTCIRIITLFIESHFWAPSFVKRARFSIGKPTHRTHHGTHSRVHEFRVSDVRGAHHIPNPLR